MNKTFKKIFGRKKNDLYTSLPKSTPFDCFLSDPALSINEARLKHLDSLNIELEGKTVLEVGAGIGLHSQYFIDKGCILTISDGNSENVEEIARRYPNVATLVFDVEKDFIPVDLKEFDIIYCYGVLYHLKDPRTCLETLAKICKGLILLESCVSLGDFPEVYLLKDFSGNNQALSGVGCRPTRSWVVNTLKELFGNVYLPYSQPAHQDFISDWITPETQMLYRAVFIGSKSILTNPNLTDKLISFQNKLSE